MKVMTLNANGIRSAARKGFFEWMAQENPDFVCIQETKAQWSDLQHAPLFFPELYHCDYFSAEKKGYSGVAIYARQKPVNIIKGLGFKEADTEGRYIQFDYPTFSIASIYFPSGTSGDGRQAVKYSFLAQIAEYFKQQRAAGRELILCGDFNIAHLPIDLKNWRTNQKTSGFLPEERAWLDSLFGELGFVDAFRLRNQAAEQYTWWSHRGQARAKNVGWRIDYQVITPNLASSVIDVAIHPQPFFSDHAPVVVNYEGAWCV
jgi:exodeoxyribonuclease-3